MHVEYALTERVYELYVIHSLVSQVGRIVVEAESRVVVQCFQCFSGRGNIEGNFSGMYLKAIFYPQVPVGIQDGFPLGGKAGKPFFYHGGRGGGKAIQHVPDGTACKSVYHGNPQPGCGLPGLDYFFGSALVHALWIPIAPDVFGQDALMTLIDAV